ncbi:ankyrin repeat-containing domain protein [Aspergillus leporis]|uniref:Ankyrin repeat-containing domain protein n=1 Tax=Aspergillus leporis TaxID=41062 RepID=A0A5N5WPQ6_9EURO|nr:ankyrin repeat-containing domain protein [Aspergillus leporis]
MFSRSEIPEGLRSALEEGKLCDVQKYLDDGTDPNICDNKQNQRRPLLSSAAINDHVQIIELLIKRGARVNKMDAHGRTPLSWAAEHGSLDTVKVLIEHGANVNAEDEELSTPLAWVVHAGTGDKIEEVHDYLISKGAKIKLYHTFSSRLKRSLVGKCNWVLFIIRGKTKSALKMT